MAAQNPMAPSPMASLGAFIPRLLSLSRTSRQLWVRLGTSQSGAALERRMPRERPPAQSARIIHRDGLERRGSRLLGGSGSTRSQHRLLRVRVSRLGCARCISDSHTEKVTAPRRMRSGRSKALFAACRDHLSRGLTDSRRAGPGSAARGLPRMAPRLRRGSGSCGGPR
jgi:hypothetical protein